jgi:GH15 family glucan-1,4-alpha-glucosidase
MAGRMEEAVTRLQTLIDAAGDLGLWSEEYDPETGHMLGNMPQGLSHAALLHAVRAIHGAGKSNS